ncbi:MAG: GGDEF domain-containing protein [bacterium]
MTYRATSLLTVPTISSRSITDVLRDLAKGRAKIAALLLASLIAASVSMIALIAVLNAAPVSLLPIVLVLQIAVFGCVLAARSATAHRLEVLEQLVESDPATGCLNRRGFERALDDALVAAAKTQRDVALLALDLDHFKRINDQFGHNVGDAVLSEVAATLADTVGTEGVVARLGGEEFSVLLPDADAEVAGVMAERMIARLRTHQLAAVTRGHTVTMSVGIAAERVTSLRDSAALRARADEALYMAKRCGRNRVLLWAPGVRSNATPAASMAAITMAPRRSGQASLPSVGL